MKNRLLCFLICTQIVQGMHVAQLRKKGMVPLSLEEEWVQIGSEDWQKKFEEERNKVQRLEREKKELEQKLQLNTEELARAKHQLVGEKSKAENAQITAHASIQIINNIQEDVLKAGDVETALGIALRLREKNLPALTNSIDEEECFKKFCDQYPDGYLLPEIIYRDWPLTLEKFLQALRRPQVPVELKDNVCDIPRTLLDGLRCACTFKRVALIVPLTKQILAYSKRRSLQRDTSTFIQEELLRILSSAEKNTLQKLVSESDISATFFEEAFQKRVANVLIKQAESAGANIVGLAVLLKNPAEHYFESKGEGKFHSIWVEAFKRGPVAVRNLLIAGVRPVTGTDETSVEEQLKEFTSMKEWNEIYQFYQMIQTANSRMEEGVDNYT
jgi:hypothetical protein